MVYGYRYCLLTTDGCAHCLAFPRPQSSDPCGIPVYRDIGRYDRVDRVLRRASSELRSLADVRAQAAGPFTCRHGRGVVNKFACFPSESESAFDSVSPPRCADDRGAERCVDSLMRRSLRRTTRHLPVRRACRVGAVPASADRHVSSTCQAADTVTQ